MKQIKDSIIGSSEELERFESLHAQFPRRVVDIGPSASPGKPPEALVAALRHQTQRLHGLAAGAWTAIFVAVEEGDGMTWSAETAQRYLAEELPSFQPCWLPADRTPDGYPRIVELIRRRTLIQLAQDTGVVARLPAFRHRLVVLAAVGFFLLSVLGAFLAAVVKGGGSTWWLPVLSGVIAVTLTAGQELVYVVRRTAREEARRTLLDALESAPCERVDAWVRFIEQLANALAVPQHDRLVVIDDIDRLDPVTRAVVLRRLSRVDVLPEHRELWCVFEEADRRTASKHILIETTHRKPPYVVKRTYLRQRNLDDTQRLKLAQTVGAPDRADYRRVKWISRRIADASDAYGQLLDEQHVIDEHGDGPPGSLTLLYLLAIEQSTGSLPFSAAELAQLLGTNATTPDGQVLRHVFPGWPSYEGVLRAVERFGDELRRTLDEDRLAVRVFDLSGEASELIRERRGAYDLVDPGAVHLFWGLYWHRRLAGAAEVDAYRLQKLGRHLATATAPGGFKSPPGKQATSRYVEALIWTTRHLLRASLPNDIPRLLRHAEQQARSDRHRRQLRTVCWQAYAVLGDEEVLGLLLQLHRAPSSKAPQPSALDELFLESLSLVKNGHNGHRALSVSRLQSLDPDVRAYGRVRALLLDLTFGKPLGGQVSLIFPAAKRPLQDAAEITREALGRLLDPHHGRTAIDALTTSLGLWSYALAFHAEHAMLTDANELLEDVYLAGRQLADNLRDARATGATEDFVLRAFVQELEVVAAAAALIVADTIAARIAPAAERKRLEQHLIDMVPDASTSKGRARAIDGRLSLLAYLWVQLGYSPKSPLGFEQLSSYATIRRAHFAVLTQSRGGGVGGVHNALSALASQLGARGVISLLAHGVAATAADESSVELTAVLGIDAVHGALMAGYGPRLETDLCLAALSLAHSYPQLHHEGFLERLSAPGATPTPLETVLDGATDRRVKQMTMFILNAVSHQNLSTEVRDTVLASLQRRTDRCQDPVASAEIAQLFDIHLIKQKRRSHSLDVGATLTRWSAWKESRHYPFALYLLLLHANAQDLGEVLEAAIEYLENAPDNPTTSGPLLLAQELLTRLDQNTLLPNRDASMSTALGYLRAQFPEWQLRLSIEANIDMIDTLLDYETGSRDDLLRYRDTWEVARQERDGLQKLPQLVDSGRYFLVFWHYWETLRIFDFRTEPEIGGQEIYDDDARADTLQQLSDAGGEIPSAMVRDSRGHWHISADFLRYGHALFSPPATDDDSWRELREAFNEQARDDLQRLLDALTSSPGIPKGIRALIAEHRGRLLRRD
ncbi:hypothetical protein [Baekduia sp.]|uniref:hypothetical protein n=1 Tax=Baekduia sp. TaxID=2600305 RepID=UPI002E08030E|nr:hypothetical protein [Baekduia sp.]